MASEREDMQPGQILARGVTRYLRGAMGIACLEEYVPCRGLRVDVVGLTRKGEIWVVECKSSRADFMSDTKWQGYLPWCDRYFWAVGPEFPRGLLPDGTGIMVADGYGAEILRMAPLDKLAAARRKAMSVDIARQSMQRLARYSDPGMRGGQLI